MRSFLEASKPTLRKAGSFAASIALLVVLTPAALYATPITYDLLLTPAAGSLYGGAGSITIEDAPALSGVSNYTHSSANLDDVTFTLDNQTFTLAGTTGTALVQFLNGQLNDITFAETVGASPSRFTLDSTAGYAFYYNDGRAASYGSISVSPTAVSALTTATVSEPASLVLFGTGLLLSIGLLYRTNSPRFISKAHQPEA